MIETVKGTITDVRDGCLVVDVHGIGYRIQVTPQVTTEASLGDTIHLHTSFLIREERQYLYGFRTRVERELFDVLLTVSGIGAKTALALLGLQADQLVSSITVGDERVLKKIPGIGAKTAKRVILELRDKIGKEFIGEFDTIALGEMGADGVIKPMDISFEALEALEVLGYERSEAVQRLRKAKKELGDSASIEEVITMAISRSD